MLLYGKLCLRINSKKNIILVVSLFDITLLLVWRIKLKWRLFSSMVVFQVIILVLHSILFVLVFIGLFHSSKFGHTR